MKKIWSPNAKNRLSWNISLTRMIFIFMAIFTLTFDGGKAQVVPNLDLREFSNIITPSEHELDMLVSLDTHGIEILQLSLPNQTLILSENGIEKILFKGVLFAQFQDSGEILFITKQLSLIKYTTTGKFIELLPEKTINGPLFVKPDNSQVIAYLKPGNFEGNTPLSNSIAVMNLDDLSETILFHNPSYPIHLYGWSGDSIIVEVPMWSPDKLKPYGRIWLGKIPSDTISTSISTIAELPGIKPETYYPHTDPDQEYITYEGESGVVIASLHNSTYAFLQGYTKPFWRGSKLITRNNNYEEIIDLSSIIWHSSHSTKLTVPLPEQNNYKTLHPPKLVPDNTQLMLAVVLYRPVSSTINISYYYDLNRTVGPWLDFMGYTGTEPSYGHSYDQHEGTDYDGENGVYPPIYAAEKGTVGTIYIECANTYPIASYGTNFRIEHGTLSDGNSYSTGYAHLKCDSVSVTQGEVISSLPRQIAQMGNTGNSTGDHLHLNVRQNGLLVDPYKLNIISDSPASGSVCPAPTLNSPPNDYISTSQTITFSWTGPVGCTFSGYTFRVKDTPDMESGGTTIYDEGQGGTSVTKDILTQWNYKDLYWGVRTANPLSPNWAVRHFRIEPSSSNCPVVSGEVRLYDFTNCGGDYVYATEAILYSLVSNFNDRAESVAVPSGWSARLYLHDSESSPSICLSSTDSDLWNNTFSDGSTVANQATWMRVYKNTSCTSTISPPSAPTLSQPANNSTYDRMTSVLLIWNSVSGATEYYAEFWGGPGISLNSGWTTNTSWLLGTQWGGVYQWRVKARNSAGESPWSETRTLTIEYGAPSNLSATAVSTSQINLAWSPSVDAPGNIDGYRIYRNGTAIATTGSSTTSYSNTGLTSGSTYNYYVKAYKGSVESDASNTASATTQSSLSAPTLASPDNLVTLARTTNIVLVWNAVSGATGYYAEFWGGPGTSVNSGWTTNTSWSLGTQWGGVYQWRVKAHNSTIESAWSDTRTLTIMFGAPSNLTATAVSTSQINLAWSASADAPGNIDGYRVYRNGTAIATTGSSTTSYSNTGLTSGTTYNYYVKAYKGSVESDASNTASATTSTVTCYSLNITINPLSSGTVNKNPAPNCNSTQYTSGTVVQLTAVPAVNYRFISWSGDISSTSNPVSITMSSNRNVTATFAYSNPMLLKLFLPITIKAIPSTGIGINGRVLVNGAPTGGVAVELHRWDGSTTTKVLSTTTLSDGTYAFIGAPSLTSGFYYYVRYLNTTDSSRLFYWETPLINSYTAGGSVHFNDFDIADVVYLTPTPNAVVPLPTTFTWVKRPTTSYDSYGVNLVDTTTYNYLFVSNPVGYVSSYQLTSLPVGLSINTPYFWEVMIHTTDRGIGIGFYWSRVTFSSSGTGEIDLVSRGTQIGTLEKIENLTGGLARPIR